MQQHVLSVAEQVVREYVVRISPCCMLVPVRCLGEREANQLLTVMLSHLPVFRCLQQ